jgi:flagellar export protein FliJ
MRFRFRLERMRNFIQLKETVKKMETAALIQRIQEMERRKTERGNTIRSLLEQSRNQLAYGLEWVPYQTGKLQADCKEIELLEQEIIGAKHELAGKKEDLARLAMRRKALDTLKDKRRSEHRIQEERKDQKKLDELYRLSTKSK